MNYRRFAIAFALSATTALSAYAAPVVMVQFGSFETMDEAQKRLAEVKAANGAALGGLSASVREVKLPPDNLTVFRTQAGPVESRSVAQSICSKLATNGTECYVVETALADKITPATDMAAAVTAPVVSTPSASLPPITLAATETGSDVKAAMDKAASVAALPETPAAPEVKVEAKKSFWSRVNPFDGEKAEKPTAKAPIVVSEKPAPETLAEMPKVELTAPKAPEVTLSTPKVEAPSVSLSAPAVEVPSVKLETPAAPAISLAPQTYAEAPALPVLPPPPPLTAKDEEFLRSNMPMSATAKAELPKEAPVVTTPTVAAPVTVASAPLPAPGNVKVEEAKRVPLTEAKPVTSNTVSKPAVLPPVATTPQEQRPVSLLPSSTLGQRTLWAQIGQFNTPQDALAYWEQYRQTHPDFPVVRVRVVSSVMQQMHGNTRVSLNVGPFARDGFIRNLCATVTTPNATVKCGKVADMGIAANAQPPGAGYLNGSRYKR